MTDKIAKTTNASVLKHTGHGWDHWIKSLDKAGARAWTYQEKVRHLAKRHKLTPWWRHIVAHGFEVHTGQRREGQTLKGDFSLTVTKSLKISGAECWKRLVAPEGIALWLDPLFPLEIKKAAVFETKDGYFGEVRTLLKGARFRLSWQDPEWESKKTYVQVWVIARPKRSTILALNHTGIPSEKLAESLRKRWRSGFSAFKDSLD